MKLCVVSPLRTAHETLRPVSDSSSCAMDTRDGRVSSRNRRILPDRLLDELGSGSGIAPSMRISSRSTVTLTVVNQSPGRRPPSQSATFNGGSPVIM